MTTGRINQVTTFHEGKTTGHWSGLRLLRSSSTIPWWFYCAITAPPSLLQACIQTIGMGQDCTTM